MVVVVTNCHPRSPPPQSDGLWLFSFHFLRGPRSSGSHPLSLFTAQAALGSSSSQFTTMTFGRSVVLVASPLLPRLLPVPRSNERFIRCLLLWWDPLRLIPHYPRPDKSNP